MVDAAEKNSNTAIENDNTVSTTVRVPRNLWAAVKSLSTTQGVTAQQIVEDALRSYLSEAA
jgi:predicted DNA binding CopG/RHH family protein